MKRVPSLGQCWLLVKQAGSAWLDDYAPSMGAALSYYTVFSLAPMLLIVIAVAGLVFGQEAARGALFEQLSGMMGADAAKAVEGLLASVSKPSKGIWANGDRRGHPAHRCDHRVRRAARRAQSNLARSEARRERRPLGPAAHPAALVRNDPRHRLPADGVAGREHRSVGARQVVEPCVRRLGSLGLRRHVPVRPGGDDGRLCRDLQVHAARRGAVARRLDRRGGHRLAVFARAGS